MQVTRAAVGPIPDSMFDYADTEASFVELLHRALQQKGECEAASIGMVYPKRCITFQTTTPQPLERWASEAASRWVSWCWTGPARWYTTTTE